MAQSRTYSTAGAFRKALEERLKKASETERIDLNRLRRHVSFDRLLARLFRAETPPWVLIPAELAAPPSEWQLPFQALAEECELPPDIATVFARLRDFFERVLANQRGVDSE
jgi:hypothetical protein